MLDFAACGMRFSGPRKAIYEWLIAHPVHPTADTIYQALRPTMPTLSRTTVYNVLHTLVDRGLAQRVQTEDGEARFDGEVRPHAHFKCERCGRVVDIPMAELLNPDVPKGYHVARTVLVYRGFCAECAAAAEQGT